MTTLGAVFLPQLPPERLRSIVQVADESGLPELWLWEDCFLESGIATAAAALAWSERLRVGVGLLPVPLRNVALTAMETATLCRLFPERVQIGVGHGVQGWMEQVGARVSSPLTLLREHLDALRALLRGDEVTVPGPSVSLAAVALDWPPAAPPPIFAGATGPRTLELTGACADGTILTAGTSPQAVARSREVIGDNKLVVYLHAATGHSAARRLEAERIRCGYDSITDISVSGDAPAVAAGVRRWAEAGADTVVLQPTEDDPDPAGFVRFVAEEVLPLLE